MYKNCLNVFLKTRKYLCLFITLIFTANIAKAQFDKTEKAPPSIKWYEKKGQNFKVIFPKELDSVANHTINFLEKNIDKIKVNPGDRIRRSNIILHNQNTISNAFVASFPRRSEFFINARPESSHFIHNNNWSDLLSIHEFRHLVQRELGHNTGFNRFVHTVFGEGLSSLLTRSSLPNWYWEGDAVDIETRESNFGRGRIPKFNLTTRNNLLSQNKIKYDRQILGTFRYKTPNEYEHGYLMVKYLKDNFGIKSFNKIVEKAHNQSFLPVPFYRAMKKETGLNYKELYNKSIATLPIKNKKHDKTPLNRHRKKSYISYKYPRETNKGIVVIRQGMGSYQDFGIINKTGGFIKIHTPGIVDDFGRIPYSNNLIGWLEFKKDPRWEKRTFSIIKLLDLNTNKVNYSGRNSFYSSFDISPSGANIVAIQNNIDGSQSLVFEDIKERKITSDIKLKDGTYSSVQYINDDEILVLITQKGIKKVCLYNIKSSVFREVFNTTRNIGWPNLTSEHLLFTAENNGFEEIFVHDIKKKETFLFKESNLGNYYPILSTDKKTILYSSMNNNGFDIFSDSLIDKNLTKIQFKENNLKTFNDTTNTYFETNKTNMAKHFIRPVSWGISDFGISSRGIDYVTLGLESRNLFGSFLFNGGYKFDIRDKKPIRYFGLSYQGLYPILDFRISGTDDSFNQDILLNNRDGSVDTLKNADINYKTKEVTFGVRVPLSYYKGKYFINVLGLLEFSSEKFKDFYTTALTSESGKFPLNSTRNSKSYINNFIYLSRKHKKTIKQVYFPYEQTVIFENKNTLLGSDYSGKYLRSDVYLAFPGFFKNHSFRSKFHYEKQKETDYRFRRTNNFISGYETPYLYSDFYGWGLEYELPLVYPDISIGPLVNFQRIRSTWFLNGGEVSGESPVSFRDTPISFGVEIVFDVNFFRQPALFDIGIKFSHVTKSSLTTNSNKIEITIGSITF